MLTDLAIVLKEQASFAAAVPPFLLLLRFVAHDSPAKVQTLISTPLEVINQDVYLVPN